MNSVASSASMIAGGLPSRRMATIEVGGMTCGACSSTVERSLAMMDGVAVATVSCVTGLARVEFDPKVVKVEDLVEAVEDVGFDATVAQEEEAAPAAEASAPGRCQEARQMVSIELKVSGMTCGACSGTVERLLNGLPGISRATVSLILGRAYVVCDAAQQTPAALCEEIECVGFDAEVVSTSAAGELKGQAQLHVRASCSGEHLEGALCDIAGALGHRAIGGGLARVVYDPHAVGARRLLAQLQAVVGEAEWASYSGADERLQGHLRHIQELQRDFFRAAPLAAIIFLLVIIAPSVLGHEHVLVALLMYQIHPGLSLMTAVVLLLATPVQFVAGRRFHTAARAALKRRSPNMDVLVSVASNTAYFYSAGLVLFCLSAPGNVSSHQLASVIGHFLAMGPILIAVVLLGKNIESRAKLQAMEALTDLPSSLPATAVLCDGSGDSVIPLELVELGDVLRVFAGGRVPVDGTMCSEAGVHVDESLLTGESRPVSKKEGDTLFGGTMCLSGGCLMRVTKVGGDTTLGQMTKLVQDAQASKAGVQRVADSIARVFVPFVIGLAAFTFTVWALLVFRGIVKTPDSHFSDHHGIAVAPEAPDSLKLLFAMKFGIAVLMIACPCAMGLATPMAVMVSTGLAAKRGCLIKSAEALELSARLDVVVLDKTGTVTEGAPRITAAAVSREAFEPLRAAWAGLRAAPAASGTSRTATADSTVGCPVPQMVGASGALEEGGPDSCDAQDCFWWVLSNLESASDHPIARCVLSAVQTIPNLPPIVAPQDFEVTAGRGVRCTLGQLGGATARVGNLNYFTESSSGQLSPSSHALLQWVADMQRQGSIVVLLHVGGVPFGAVALQDPVREDAAWMVDYLKQRLGVEVWMCTGDNEDTARHVGGQVGIDNIVAEALPQTKRECVEGLQRPAIGGRRPRRVCFVGDGMNDSPALAQADVGVALGVGAHVAVEAADVALVRSELADYVSFLALSRATFRTVILNFFWAFCFNFLCLPIAAGLFYPVVYIPPLAAGLGMALSSLLVVCSSLLLKRFKSPLAPHLQDRLKASSAESRPLFDSGDSAQAPVKKGADAPRPPSKRGADAPRPQVIGGRRGGYDNLA